MARKTVTSIIHKIQDPDGTLRAHITDRTINQEFLFKDPEIKDLFRNILWDAAIFFDVVVYTYALLDNHYHLNLKIPSPYTDTDRPNDDELIRRYRVWYGEEKGKEFKEKMETLKKSGKTRELERERAQLLKRMHQLSSFQQALNQRFTQLYNKKKKRSGPVFSGRYHLSGYLKQPSALCFISSYIERNPVRVNLSSDYGLYEWSGLADALQGNPEARKGICELIEEAFKWENIGYSTAVEIYNAILVNGYYEVALNLFGKCPEEAVSFVRTLPRHTDFSSVKRILEAIQSNRTVSMQNMLSCTLRILSRAHIFKIEKGDTHSVSPREGYYPIGNGLFAHIDHKIRGPDAAEPS